MKTWTDEKIVSEIIADLTTGMVVNVGIGLPTKMLSVLPDDLEILVQSENGILGVSGIADENKADPDLVDAGKNYIKIRKGASVFDSSSSFGMLRGGHVDLAVLGAYQVAANGDIANWKLPSAQIAGIGGAADICAGVKEVWAVLKHRTKQGEPKLVSECDYPLTAKGVVTRIYTDIGVLRVRNDAFEIVKRAEGVSQEEIEKAIAAPVVS